MNKVRTVTSFISRQTSKDWSGDCARLEATMQSVMVMDSSFIGSIIVGHDCPSFVSDNPRITWIQATHSPPVREALKDEKLHDIGTKLVLGTRAAYKSGSSWMMYLDADDLVSRRLERLCDLENHDAVVLSGGYWWDPSSNLLKRSFRINKSCGSTHLVRLNPKWFPYWLGGASQGPRIADQSHADIHSALIRAGARIQQISWAPMIAYRVGSSHSISRNKITNTPSVSIRSLRNLLLQKKTTGKTIEEFSIPQ